MIIRSYVSFKCFKYSTKCVCETLMPPKLPFIEKFDIDVWPWPWQMTLTLVPAAVYRWHVLSHMDNRDMLSFYVKLWANRLTDIKADRRTPVKQYTPDAGDIKIWRAQPRTFLRIVGECRPKSQITIYGVYIFTSVSLHVCLSVSVIFVSVGTARNQNCALFQQCSKRVVFMVVRRQDIFS